MQHQSVEKNKIDPSINMTTPQLRLNSKPGGVGYVFMAWRSEPWASTDTVK